MVWGIIIVVILIVVYLGLSNHPGNGFWVAPQDFLDEAGLDSLILFLGKDGSYIFAMREDEVMMNDVVDVNFSWFGSSVRFNGISYDFFPSVQSTKITPGKLVLYKGDTVYAVLYHNAELSDLDPTKK